MVDGGVEQDAEGYAWFADQLAQAGYRQVAPDCFTRSSPPFPLCRGEEFLGVGLAAESRFDGYNPPKCRTWTPISPRMEAMTGFRSRQKNSKD